MLFPSFFLASCPAALRNKIRWGWTVLKGQTRDREVHFDSSQVKFGSNVLPTQQDLSAKTSQSEEWCEYRSNKVCRSVTERETVEKQQLAAIYEQRVFVVIKITAGLDCRHSCLLNSWRCFDCNYNKWWKLQHDDFKFSSMVDENSGDRWSHAGSSWRGHEAIHPVIVQTFQTLNRRCQSPTSLEFILWGHRPALIMHICRNMELWIMNTWDHGGGVYGINMDCAIIYVWEWGYWI